MHGRHSHLLAECFETNHYLLASDEREIKTSHIEGKSGVFSPAKPKKTRISVQLDTIELGKRYTLQRP